MSTRNAPNRITYQVQSRTFFIGPLMKRHLYHRVPRLVIKCYLADHYCNYFHFLLLIPAFAVIFPNDISQDVLANNIWFQSMALLVILYMT